MIYNDINKIQVAENQLKTAIHLFFQNGDSISIHTLVSAAQEILEAIALKSEIKSMKIRGIEKLSGDKKRKFIENSNRHKNFFKHADRDYNEKTQFDSSFSELVLLDAVRLYFHITANKIATFIIYDVWASTKYPGITNFKNEEVILYEVLMENHKHEDKHYFLNLILEEVKKAKRNVLPYEKSIIINNKEFINQVTELDNKTSVWSSFFTINGEYLENSGEGIILNFYLNDFDNNVTAEKVSKAFIANAKNIIGFPFTAPDNVTKEPAYLIFSFEEHQKYGYIYITKISSIGNSVFSLIYVKKIIQEYKTLQESVSNWLSRDIQSNYGIANDLSNTTVDLSWIEYLSSVKN